MYTVVTTSLHTLRWHLFVQPVLIRNRARPRIQRALDYSAQFGQAEINRPRANYSRKYGILKQCFGEVVRKQEHLQQKQNQLASKQDLLHSTIAGEHDTLKSPTIMCSPLISPPLTSWSLHSQQVHVPPMMCAATAKPTVEDLGIPEDVSSLAETESGLRGPKCRGFILNAY